MVLMAGLPEAFVNHHELERSLWMTNYSINVNAGTVDVEFYGTHARAVLLGRQLGCVLQPPGASPEERPPGVAGAFASPLHYADSAIHGDRDMCGAKERMNVTQRELVNDILQEEIEYGAKMLEHHSRALAVYHCGEVRKPLDEKSNRF